ncbi:hypothetical protein [Trichormus sp. NMC-1]|uniref:hypothetical protein n=1 Tax=Trichormus sp. NMC-1 TaxID=1853259 RepID=UPI000AC53FE8|nr:hypothetical protein [Trichormus sp. NMC-1]
MRIGHWSLVIGHWSLVIGQGIHNSSFSPRLRVSASPRLPISLFPVTRSLFPVPYLT